MRKILSMFLIAGSLAFSGGSKADEVDDYFEGIRLIARNPKSIERLFDLNDYVKLNEKLEKGITQFCIETCVRSASFHVQKPRPGDEMVSDFRIDTRLRDQISYKLQKLFKEQYALDLEGFLSAHEAAVTAATVPLRGVAGESQELHRKSLIERMKHKEAQESERG